MGKRRPVVVVFVSMYLPGFRGGGPIRSISNMVEALSEEYDFRIVTTDRDLGDKGPYEAVIIDAWNQVGKALVYYASPASRTLRGIQRILREIDYDVLYLNSFFSPDFAIKPLLLRRAGLIGTAQTVVAPRGEFSEGAYFMKGWKKRPFVKLMAFLKLYRDIIWHASTELEAKDIQRALGGLANHIRIAPNLVSTSVESELPKQVREAGNLRICFLSRISPKKNLDYAIRVLSQLDFRVFFDIYGPIESQAYWSECEKLIDALPSNVKVIYQGPVENERVKEVIADYDLLFVPTRGENFGHVFAEALCAGVPILLSDQTPWRDLEEKGVGWDIPLSEEGEFTRALQSLNKYSGEKRLLMRRCCQRFASERLRDAKVVEMNRRLLAQPS